MPKAAGKIFVSHKAILFAGFATLGVLAAWLLLATGVINVSLTLKNTEVQAETGYAFIVRSAVPGTPYLFTEDRTLELRENGRRLGPGFALHSDIRGSGAGKYSAWGDFIYFSSSDNVSPATNGRTYTLRGPVVPAVPWLTGAGVVLLLSVALTFLLRRMRLGTISRGGIVVSVATGALLALLPVMNRISLDLSPLAMTPFLVLLVGISLMVRSVAMRTDAASGRLAAIQVGALALVIFSAVGTSGLLQGRHHVDPEHLDQTKPNVYEYGVQGLPLGLELARDEERTLANRTLISDATGPLVPGQPLPRLEALPGGLSSFWYRTAFVSFRNPGGPNEPGNALTMTGALRIGPNAFGIMLGIVALAIGLIGGHGMAWQANSSNAPVPSHLRLPPSAMCGAALSLIALAVIGQQPAFMRAASTEIGFATQLRVTHLLTITAALLVLVLLPWRLWGARAPARDGRAWQAVIVLIALAAPLFGLLDARLAAGRDNSVSMTSLHILGSMQSSDAFAYLRGALGLIATGDLDGWNSRRPLTSVLLTLRILAGSPDMAAVMLLGALLISAGLMLAAREVLLVAGGWAALAFVVACGGFAAEWSPSTLSEGPGLAMGLFGLAAIMAAWRRDSYLIFGLGVAALSIGLMARAGPLLVLPAVIVTAVIVQWRFGTLRVVAWLAAGIAGAALGFAHSVYLVGLLRGSFGMIQSNFSYVLYGLAVGGKGWMQILTDHPELFAGPIRVAPEPRIFALAMEAIRANPSLMVGALIDELRNVPAFFYGYFDTAAVNFWLMSGAVIAILAIPNRWAALALAAIVGLYLSSPLIMSDGGTRVYATAVPFLGLLVAFGFDAFRRGISLLAAGAAPRDILGALRTPALAVAGNRSAPLLEPSSLGAMAILGLILVAPHAINWTLQVPKASLDLGPACEPGQTRVVLGRTTVQLFQVEPDRVSETLIVPKISQRNLLKAARIHAPVFGKTLSALAPPYTLNAVVRVGNLGATEADAAIAVWSAGLHIARDEPYFVACAIKIGETDLDTIGKLDIYDVKSTRPIGFVRHP